VRYFRTRYNRAANGQSRARDTTRREIIIYTYAAHALPNALGRVRQLRVYPGVSRYPVHGITLYYIIIIVSNTRQTRRRTHIYPYHYYCSTHERADSYGLVVLLCDVCVCVCAQMDLARNKYIYYVPIYDIMQTVVVRRTARAKVYVESFTCS